MSAQLQVTGEAKIRDIQGPVVANDGVITALDGLPSQYVRGDGTLADIPTVTGGGSSVSYYLNGSVNQGTFGGSTYYQMSRDAITGTGTNFSTSSDGLLAQFITDAGDPDVSSIPSGNWNIEFFMNVSASSGSLASFYVEFYKYDGSTFTLIASNSATPEQLTNTTTVDAYYTSVAFAETALATTDRLAIRIYANVASKTVTLYTEDNRLCQIVTTFSKGLLSMNSLTDQEQYLTTGTSGTNFAIVSSGDTHTFNLPVASATNTGKLSSTDWTTFNNKQDALTNPITGTGAAGKVAYFDGTTSITSESSFIYDASTNRLGVNTTTPNATIGANAATDSGYSLLLKNDNANYNGIGFGTDSTYGNLIQADRTGSAPSRNLTLYNYAGFMSLTESGNLGIGLLTPNIGIDIYNSTNSFLWLHNDATGLTSTDGVRLALFSSKSANLRNFDGAFSITAEGDFSVITLGAENIRVNSADGKVGIGNPTTVSEMLTVNGSIQQSGVLSSMLKSNGDGKIIAAVAGTDYVAPSALSGYVPTSRTLTINGTAYDLSADRSWSVGTITGSAADGRVSFGNGTNSISYDSGFVYDSTLNRLGVNTVSPNATIGSNAGLDSNYSLLLKNSDTDYNGLGFRIDSTYGHMIETTRTGSAIARNLTMINNGGFFSVSEAGNFGFNILAVNTGVDIYASTNTYLWLHNGANTGSTQGARLAYFSTKSLNLRNFEGPLSLTSEGDFQIITLGAENLRVNSANGYIGIGNPATVLAQVHVYNAENAASLLLQTNGATSYSEIAVRNASSVATSYFRQYSSSTTGTDFGLSRANLATFFSNYASNFAIGTQNGGDLIFGTDNTERLRITTGIATFSTNLVAINGNGLTEFKINNNTSEWELYMPSGSTDLRLYRGSDKVAFLANGNVGIGTNTPNANSGTSLVVYDSSTPRIRLTNSTTGQAAGDGSELSLYNSDLNIENREAGAMNFYVNGSKRFDIASTGAATFSSSVTATQFKTASSFNVEYGNDGYGGYAYVFGANGYRFYTNGSERLAITSGGNVGIGVVPSGGDGILSTNGYAGTFGDSSKRRGLSVFSTSAENSDQPGVVLGYDTSGAGIIAARTNSSGQPLAFWTYNGSAWGERMRITSSGALYINGTTSDIWNVSTGTIGQITFNSSGFPMAITKNDNLLAIFNRIGSTGDILEFKYNASVKGSISTNGTNVSYNTSSDYRLKEDLKEINGLEKVSAIKVYDFRWKTSKERTDGVLAHELAEVLPYAVIGEKDGEKMQGVDYSKIVPVLVKAIQELSQELNELKAKI